MFEPILSGSSEISRFQRGDAIEICSRIMFYFYPGLPHIVQSSLDVSGPVINLPSFSLPHTLTHSLHRHRHRHMGQPPDSWWLPCRQHPQAGGDPGPPPSAGQQHGECSVAQRLKLPRPLAHGRVLLFCCSRGAGEEGRQ